MPKKINVSIVGAGRIAEHHLKAIKKVKGFKLTAVCDLNHSKAYNFSKKYNVPYYLDYNEMLKKVQNIDIVAIMTPSGCHYEHCRDIILKYKKNLIVEKPTFLNPTSKFSNPLASKNQSGCLGKPGLFFDPSP